MADVDRIEKRLREVCAADTARGVARTLAEMPELQRVNLALDLVEGVTLESYMPPKPTPEQGSNRKRAKKPETSWSL